jgi:hypothetical protein
MSAWIVRRFACSSFIGSRFLAIALLVATTTFIPHFLKAQCTKGFGNYKPETCCSQAGCVACQGYLVSVGQAPNSGFTPKSNGCSCVYQAGGCTGLAEVKQFIKNQDPKGFQTSPVFFLGCNGSVLALTTQRRLAPKVDISSPIVGSTNLSFDRKDSVGIRAGNSGNGS